MAYTSWENENLPSTNGRTEYPKGMIFTNKRQHESGSLIQRNEISSFLMKEVPFFGSLANSKAQKLKNYP
jgi:hypothetical protein